MDHRTPPSAGLALAFAFLLGGCIVDNSGGPPPGGDAIDFEVALVGPSYFCAQMEDQAHLIADSEGLDAFIDSCDPGEAADIDAVDQALGEQLEALEEGQALLVVNTILGGCFGDWRVEAVHRDGDTLRPWVLKADTAYGQQSTGCPADIGQGNEVLVVEGASDATAVELTVGVYNPDLPGSPDEAITLE